MKVTERVLLLSLALLLVACGDNSPPVVLKDAQADYFGSWEHVGSEYGNDIVSDNMLLVFHPDSTVSYKRCINRMNGHTYTSFPDARIRSLTDKQLVITAGIWFLHFTRTLPINRAPYVDGGESYLEVDGLKLRKLRAGESSTHSTWKCDSDDDRHRDKDEDEDTQV
ncbi:MAG TPA: hypothetical protein VKB34_18950 [Povalibacter sp.]|nr:hypothetical protein [Povalibacter sp.]